MAARLRDAPTKVIESFFKYYDGDSSGLLGEEEFASILVQFGITDETQQEGLKKLADDDNDGKISLKEFENWLKQDDIMAIIRSSAKLDTLEMIVDLFEAYDGDGDGRVTWLEWQKAFVDRGSTVEEARQLWAATDTDGDSVVIFGEFWQYITKVMEA